MGTGTFDSNCDMMVKNNNNRLCINYPIYLQQNTVFITILEIFEKRYDYYEKDTDDFIPWHWQKRMVLTSFKIAARCSNVLFCMINDFVTLL